VLLEHSFTVPVPVEHAWTVLLDIERVAPCMPGATLTSVEDEAFTGTVKVKLGPVSMTFKGSGRFVERDEAARRVVLTASGADSRGGGTAAAKVTAALHPAGDGTRVEVSTDLDITGKAAQFGRGLIGDVSGRLIGQFADCLAGKLAAGTPETTQPETAQPETAQPETAQPETAPAETTPAAVTPSGDGSSGAAGAGGNGSVYASAAAARPATAAQTPVEPSDEVEPIDLLAISGLGSAVRRAVPYVVTAAASFAVVLGIIWWIKRR
jgi:carbon monoxide dehydrogenase subunit G